MKIKIVIIAVIFAIISQVAQAEDFMLPNSFIIDKNDLPAVEEKEQENQTTEQATVSKTKKEKPVAVVNNIERNSGISPKRLTPVVTDISLTDLVRNFSYEYSKTLRSTMATLTQFNIKPVCYDSSRGQIKAELKTGKELFIILLPSQEKLTHVRITPADGRYNISKELVNDIFKNIERNLYSDIN